METEEGTSIVWLWADKLLYLYFYPEEFSSSGVHVTFFYGREMKQKISTLKRGTPSANIGLEKIRTYAFNKRPVDYEEEPGPKRLLHEYEL